jgi:hypothetical protein
MGEGQGDGAQLTFSGNAPQILVGSSRCDDRTPQRGIPTIKEALNKANFSNFDF